MYNSALHQINPIVENTLKEATIFFGNLRKQDFSGRVSRPPCFDGIIQTINGILFYYQKEKEKNPDIYIITSKFNQDILENLFGTFRQRGGSNVNPTSRIFRNLFRSHTVNCLIKPTDTANYECSTSELDLLFDDANNEQIISSQGKHIDISSQASNSSSDETPEMTDSGSSNSEKENLENAAITYFAGYLAHYVLKKYKCDMCAEMLLSKNIFFTDKHDHLLFYKMYGSIIKVSEMQGLKKPSKKMCNIVKTSLKFFDKEFQKIYFGKNIKGKLTKKLEKHFKKTKNFCKGICKDHHIFLLDHLIKIKIFKYCKSRSVSSQKQVTKKLCVLQNV